MCALRSIIRASSLLALACLTFGGVVLAQVSVNTGGTGNGIVMNVGTGSCEEIAF
jgi:hypothetical protein